MSAGARTNKTVRHYHLYCPDPVESICLTRTIPIEIQRTVYLCGPSIDLKYSMLYQGYTLLSQLQMLLTLTLETFQ